MAQLNEYPIEELKGLKNLLDAIETITTNQVKSFGIWYVRIEQAIADREFSDSQLPFRTPKEIEQDERINNAKFI